MAPRTWTRAEYEALALPRVELIRGKICGSDAEAWRLLRALAAQVGLDLPAPGAVYP